MEDDLSYSSAWTERARGKRDMNAALYLPMMVQMDLAAQPGFACKHLVE